MSAKKKPLGFTRIGRITVPREVVGGWECRCDCGKEWVVTGFNLRGGKVKRQSHIWHTPGAGVNCPGKSKRRNKRQMQRESRKRNR